MNGLAAISLLLFFLIQKVNAQESEFWGADTSDQIRIYSIKFTTTENGLAESYFGDVLKTTDGGQTWQEVKNDKLQKYISAIKTDDKIDWSVDIFCAVMKTTDGGENWKPYHKKQEEHFCQVYFKDENTGWKVAEEFLNKVITTITTSIEKGDCESNSGIIHKCREYYTDIDEGWTLGWCYRNYISLK
jgi:hypothetical protein